MGIDKWIIMGPLEASTSLHTTGSLCQARTVDHCEVTPIPEWADSGRSLQVPEGGHKGREAVIRCEGELTG